MFAKQVEEAGFDALYVTGYGTAADWATPTWDSLPRPRWWTTSATSAPRPHCRPSPTPTPATAIRSIVVRTIQEYERAGVAGLHMEDQVFPKKCGFFEGKDVIPTQDHVQKLRAALDSRQDKDFVIIARTDALAVNGWDDTVARCKAYYDAGADLVFVDGIRTKDDLVNYSDRLAKKGLPCLYNGGLVSQQEASDLGFKIQIIAGLALGAIYLEFNRAMKELKETGIVAEMNERFEPTPPGDGFNELLGLPRVYELERRYGVNA
ncbi:MAG: isocitrate lyase/PEP mutase family protein [Dehalococcoidia bacterium]